MSPATLEALAEKSGDGFGWLIEGYIYIRPPLSAKRLMKLVDANWNLSMYSEKTMGAQKHRSRAVRVCLHGGGGHGNWFQEPTLNKKKGLNLQQAGICSKNYLISFFVCLWCIGNPMQSLCQTSFLSQRTLTKCLLHHEMIISHQQYRRKKRRIIIKNFCYSDTKPRTLLKGNKGFMIYPHDFFLTLKRIPHYQQTTGKWK